MWAHFVESRLDEAMADSIAIAVGERLGNQSWECVGFHAHTVLECLMSHDVTFWYGHQNE